MTYIFHISQRSHWLKEKHYDKCDDFTFPMVNFPFISSNIPVLPAYGVYMSQLIRYSRSCAQYSDFLDRTLLLTQKLLKEGYVASTLKSLQQDFYGRYHDLVDRYEISIFQMATDPLLCRFCLSSFADKITRPDYMHNTVGVLYETRTVHPSRAPVLALGLLRYVLFASTCVNPWLIEVCVVREHLC